MAAATKALPSANGGQQSQVPAPAEETFLSLLEKSKGEFAKLTGDERKADRIIRICRTAWQMKPELRECAPVTIIACAMKALELGLDPDGAQQHAHLIAYFNKKKNRTECSFQIGYRGFLKLAHNTRMFRAIEARVVRKSDKFDFYYDPEPHLMHKPGDSADDRELTHVYCYSTTVEGGMALTVMPRSEIDKARACSKRQEIWNAWYGEMACKTVVKRHMKRQPSSPEMAEAIEHDDRDYDPSRLTVSRVIMPGENAVTRLANSLSGQLPSPEPEEESQEPDVAPEEVSQEPVGREPGE